MSRFHFQVLPSAQRELWNRLSGQAGFLRDQGYYLAGGTALALQLGHRQSIDFDFFSEKKSLSALTGEWLAAFTQLVPRDRDEHTLHAEADGVKVSFLGGYRYPTVEPLVEAGTIRVAAITDIALMKLLALTHRAALRDYIDLAAILRGPVELPKLLEASKKKYGPHVNPMIFLRALATFEDIEPESPVMLDRDLERSWQKILRDAIKLCD